MTANLLELNDYDLGIPSGPKFKCGIQFVVGAGQIAWVRGQNGSDKSTLLKQIMEADISSPSLKIHVPITERALFAQNVSPFGFPVLQAIELESILISKAGTSRTDAQRKIFDPEGRDQRWARRSLHLLSGGELKRVLLSGLLRSSARLLLLDEPENNLDQESMAALLTASQEFVGQNDRGILWVTHRHQPQSGQSFLDLDRQ